MNISETLTPPTVTCAHLCPLPHASVTFICCWCFSAIQTTTAAATGAHTATEQTPVHHTTGATSHGSARLSLSHWQQAADSALLQTSGGFLSSSAAQLTNMTFSHSSSSGFETEVTEVTTALLLVTLLQFFVANTHDLPDF